MNAWFWLAGVALIVAATCALILALPPEDDDETEAWARFREGMRDD